MDVPELAEYLRISEQVAASSTRTWQAAAFLVGGAFAAAGLIVSRGITEGDHFVETIILGAGIIVVLILFHLMFIRREHWRGRVLYAREEEIERKFKMYAGRYVHWLDDIRKNKGVLPPGLTVAQRRRLQALPRSPGVLGERFTVFMIWIAISMWVALIVAVGILA